METIPDIDFLLDISELKVEVFSRFSRIRVYSHSTIRIMTFVDTMGRELVESAIDLENPHLLLVEYTRFMLLSYLFCPVQRNVLMVGLGGGAMVHFLRNFDCHLKIKAVEVDPTIVDLAAKHFSVRSNQRLQVICQGGFDYLTRTKTAFDVIYVDAFTSPSETTDRTGAPRVLRSPEFYRAARHRLCPNGVLVVNLNPHQRTGCDMGTLTGVFPMTQAFWVPETSNIIMLASEATFAEECPEPNTATRKLVEFSNNTFSFENMVASRFSDSS